MRDWHRVCTAAEHAPHNGMLHGCCVTCGENWPCSVEEERLAMMRSESVAPELLAALEEITNYAGGADHATEDDYVMGRVAEAIAKARGEA